MNIPRWVPKDFSLPGLTWYSFLRGRLEQILLYDQTSNTRLWFGITSLFFGLFMYYSKTAHNSVSEYALMLKFAPDWAWAICFVVNGLSLVYGAITEKFNTVLLVLEGALGAVVWVASAYCVVVTQGGIGAQFAGAVIASWIYFRYPTHRKHGHGP